MIAAGIGIIALIVIALHGRSASSSVLRLSGETAWLASTVPGIVSDVSGSAAAPDASVSISAMRGHHVSVIQDGSMVLTADRDTGMAWLISPSQLAVEKSFKMGPAESAPLSADGQIYDIDQASGTIQYVRSLPSSLVRAPVNLRIGPGDSVIGAGGILWVARSSDGNILPVRQGRVGRAWRVAPPHDNLALTSAGNSAVVANASTGVVTSISPAGRRISMHLPFRAASLNGLVSAGPGRGPWAAFAVPSTAKLIFVDIQRRKVASLSLANVHIPLTHLRQSLIVRTRFYVADGVGRLLIFDVLDGRLLRSVQVSGPAGTLDIFAKGDLVWANDPAGPNAAVVDGNTVRRILKYEPRKQARHRPRPAVSRTPAPSPSPSPKIPGTGHPAPAAVLSITVSPGSHASPGQMLRFSVVSRNHRRISTSHWTFGDGSVASGVTVSHRWDRDGLFSVAVSVRWGTHSSSSAIVTVRIRQPQPPAGHLHCGSVITASVTLTHNLACHGNGLLIGADGVDLNLGGHTVTGAIPTTGSNTAGISTALNTAGQQGFSDITIRNGRVDGSFRSAILVDGSQSTLIENMQLINFFSLFSAGVEVRNSIISGQGANSAVSDIEGPGQVTVANSQIGDGGFLIDGTNVTIENSSVENAQIQADFPNSLSIIHDRLLFGSAVQISGSGSTVISGNTVESIACCWAGIDITGNAANVVITDNKFSRNWIGLRILASPAPINDNFSDARIQGNTFTDNTVAGLLLDVPSQSEIQGGTISGNIFTGNGYSRRKTKDSAGHPVDNGLHINLPPGAPTVIVKDNHASGGRSYGIYAVPGSVVDGGGNTDSGRGCIGVTCQ